MSVNPEEKDLNILKLKCERLEQELKEEKNKVKLGKSEIEALKKNYQTLLQQSEEEKYNLKRRLEQLEMRLKDFPNKNNYLTQ